jgi:midasin
MKEAKKKDITYVFIIVDSLKDSILGVKSVRLNEMQKTEIKSYLSDFPFDYFLIVKNVRELGEVLASTLLQFIQEK